MTTINDGDDDSYDQIDKGWNKVWRNAAGKIHRDGDLPAIIYANGDVHYYRNGERHRDGDLPAMIWADGSVFYCKDGRYHRDCRKPAVIWHDGVIEYWIKGVKQNEINRW